ncbi:UDP-N-acetylmuramoyl-tripeptide--D-alanyl-D-alanine ligase [Marinicella sp. W31]|uniref:UDP-N-acetylmuramoyl-tripeptide--D-alanyl-D- alanine ligase n=1 Tax=Marinicella sp. W31 TaxID=3023713 RepID=UPI0037577C92
MISMNLRQAEALTGGTLIGKTGRFNGVSTDSRKNNSGRLFVGLSGVNHNGADFCEQAIANGAVAVLVDKAVDVTVPQIICDDVQASLGSLAQGWLQQTGAMVIAITGSNGKTSVKNMLYSVLSQAHKSYATPGNFNNEIGLPLSIFDIEIGTEFAILEMGAAKIGDIAYLTRIAKPHVAIINNVSAAHTEGFGSIEGIAQGKGEIYAALHADGLAVMNADMPYVSEWNVLTEARKLQFGTAKDADYVLQDVTPTRWVLQLPSEEVLEMKAPAPGRHNAMNALAVTAICHGIGIASDQIKSGLQQYQAEAGRLQDMGLCQGVRLIHDAYNANPESVKAAIDVLKQCDQPSLLVLGDMKELGEESARYHRQVLDYAEQHDIDQVAAIGVRMQEAGKDHELVQWFSEQQQMEQWLQQHWTEYKTVMFKASRGMALEKVINTMLQWGKAA